MADKINSLSDFEPYKGDTFQVELEDSTTEVTLSETTKGIDDKVQESFSLTFTGKQDHPLPQNTYKLKQEKMGEVELFLVPVGHTGGSYEYEACISRLKEEKLVKEAPTSEDAEKS